MVESEASVKSEMSLTLRLAKVFADPLRMKILAELNMREMSPKQFFEEFGGGSVSRVSRHFAKLDEYGWLRIVREKSGGRRRGAVEHFYRATGPAVFDNNTWTDAPESVKEVVSWRIFKTLARQVMDAIKARTIDARDDRHFTWTPMLVDKQGWDAVIPKLDALFEFLFEEQARASVRLEGSGEEPIPMTVALAAFESPKDSTKAH